MSSLRRPTMSARLAVFRPFQPSVAAVEEPADSALIARVQKRDRAALGTIYDRYSHYVYATCLRVLANTADAEDVMIQVFIELWERPGQFDVGRGKLSTYLMILARSRAMDLRRSQSRRRQLIEDASDALASPTIDHVTPVDTALHNERRQHIRQALATLGALQREAVELAFVEGMSHREIAEHLNTPLGTIKTRIRHGLIQLRQSLRTKGKGTSS